MLRKALCFAALAALSAMSALSASLDFPGRQAATVGIAVMDVKTGKLVDSENYERVMIPASILKSLTSATALSRLNSDYRFETPVLVSGVIDGSTLRGDIIVKASGDPTIDSRHFPANKCFVDSVVSKIKGLGIERIEGDIIVDEDSFSDTGQNPQWVIEDVGWDYGAGWYGFNFMDNTFRLYPASGTTIPEVPDIDLMVEKSSSDSDVAKGINSDVYVVSGKQVEDKNYFVTTTMNSPSRVFQNMLVKRLQSAGIEVTEDESKAINATTQTIYTHRSPRLVEILRSLMVRSDNMMAEAMLRATSPGSSRSNAVAAELRHWQNAGVATSYVKVTDGSGLARADRVSPKFMAEMLSKMAVGAKSEQYVGLFPVAGREGTVKRILKGTALEGRVVLKSGSMSGVHCYAGYKLDADGKPTHAIVIMVNNFFCSRDAVRSAIEKWLIDTFK